MTPRRGAHSGLRSDNRESAIRGSALPQGRPITDTEWKRRQRAGEIQPDATRRKFGHHLVWTEAPRNGLPWKPYVYRGAG